MNIRLDKKNHPVYLAHLLPLSGKNLNKIQR
jgi:hypothetical protein